MTIRRTVRRYGVVLAALTLLLAACGSGDGESEAAATDEATSDETTSDETSSEEAASEEASGDDRPTVVVTTNILGDVVGELVGDQADVITIMPVGADPHDFQASAQEVDQLLAADALVVNGSDFEEGLLDVIDSARESGVPTFEATSAVETIEYAEGGHSHDEHGDDEKHDEGDEHSDEEGEHAEGDEHSDEEGEHAHDEEGEKHDEEGEHAEGEEHAEEEGEAHSDEEGEHAEGEDHGHEGADPHFFTDPTRMVAAVEGIGAFLTAEVEGLDAAALDTAVADYVGELEALDAEVEGLVEAIPEGQRVLVTNHEVFGYFADRYGFEVVGAVIPSGSTTDGASAGELAELAEIVEREGVPAVFADTSSSNELVETLAAEVGDVEVVELYSESLGDSGSDGATYVDMVRTNASRISAALG